MTLDPRYPPFALPSRSKYRAIPTYVGDIRFDSKAEARRWEQLLLLEKAGHIRALERQVPYACEVNGKLICTYIADFRYQEGTQTIVEDKKAVRTPVYRLKRKLVKALYGITILET